MTDAADLEIKPPGHRRPSCSRCSGGLSCFPAALGFPEPEQLDGLMLARKSLKRGEYLYRIGDPFTSIYAVHRGCVKNSALLDDGRDQLTGFQVRGELFGFDGIATQCHTINVVAAEASVVCVVPFARLAQLANDAPTVRAQLNRVMSREIARDHEMLALLGTRRAEHRVALFLLGLARRGPLTRPFRLALDRWEIGSYLGLTFETVSRVLSRFSARSLLHLEHKQISGLDVDGLVKLIGSSAASASAPLGSGARPTALRPVNSEATDAAGAGRSLPAAAEGDSDMATDLMDWSEDFSIHIQEVDEQHKMLVSLLNQLYRAIHEHHGSAACREILDRLADYTRTHFLLEESLMRLTHYPGFEIHKQQHEDLIEQVQALQKKLDHGSASITFELLHFLKVWLTQHMLDSDRRFGAYFERSNLGEYAKWSAHVAETMKQKKWWWKFW